MVLLFVVCGWREEAVAGVCLRTYLVHSTYVFLCARARIYGKIVKPTVPVHFVSKVKHVSWSPVKTAQNVPVHFGSKVVHPIETAQNVLVHFNKPPRRQPHVPCERLTNSRVLAK